ncbi:Meiosis-specific nuclear structural protein 1 [Plasmodiophora brassicae]
MASRTARGFDLRMAAERRAEAEISKLSDTLKAHASIKAEVASDHRVEQMRRDRERRLREAEAKQGAILEQKLRQEYEARIFDKQQQCLVAELQRRKSAQASEDARIRRLCDQSEELRALKDKLAAAQMNKERHAQMEANLRIKREKVAKEVELEARLLREREQAEKWEKERVEGRQVNLGNLKDDLDRQIQDRQQKKLVAYEEFLQEKKQVDEIVRRVHDQERLQEEEKTKKRAELREMLHKYEVERRTMKIKLKENEAAEMRKLEEWARSQEQRLSEVAAKKEEQKAREAAKYRRVAADMDNARKEQEETEQLLIELFIEEADQKIRQAAEDREARRLALRREMQEAHRQQQILIERKRCQEKEQEEALRARMMAKFAEDSRVEQMNAERARRAKLEHRRMVQKALEERRAMFEAERAEEIAAAQRQRDEEEQRLLIVERERERMLKEYARKLREYLPRGVLRNEQDRRVVFGSDTPEQGAAGAD